MATSTKEKSAAESISAYGPARSTITGTPLSADVGCIVLGRAEDETHVHTWLSTAAGVPGFIGFAVGRTTFWDPLMAWKDQKISREAALTEIARRYRQWVDVFERARVS
jgi:myo-inositol catabolism protein IolC